MSLDIEVSADEWEAYQRDMEEISEELYWLWVNDMEKEFA